MEPFCPWMGGYARAWCLSTWHFYSSSQLYCHSVRITLQGYEKLFSGRDRREWQPRRNHTGGLCPSLLPKRAKPSPLTVITPRTRPSTFRRPARTTPEQAPSRPSRSPRSASAHLQDPPGIERRSGSCQHGQALQLAMGCAPILQVALQLFLKHHAPTSTAAAPSSRLLHRLLGSSRAPPSTPRVASARSLSGALAEAPVQRHCRLPRDR